MCFAIGTGSQFESKNWMNSFLSFLFLFCLVLPLQHYLYGLGLTLLYNLAPSKWVLGSSDPLRWFSSNIGPFIVQYCQAFNLRMPGKRTKSKDFIVRVETGLYVVPKKHYSQISWEFQIYLYTAYNQAY